ncbi:hypothetical protein ABPG72_003612 [Tetrahymena utriculariae]
MDSNFHSVQVIWLAAIILNHFAWGLYGYKATINDPTDPFVLEGNKHKGKGMLWCVACKCYAQEQSKHCSQCNRCTEIFDHHCAWLNNCIGRRNKNYFFKFTVSYFIMEIQWTTLNVTYVLTQNPDWSLQDFVFIADVINLFLSIIVVLFTANLLIFHIWLTKCKKITTFEYFQQKQNKQDNKSSLYQEEQKKKNEAQDKHEALNINNTDQQMVQPLPTSNYETKRFTLNTQQKQVDIQKALASKKFFKLKSTENQSKNVWENKFKQINQLKYNSKIIKQRQNSNQQIQQSYQLIDITKVENSKFDDNQQKFNSDLNEVPNLSIYGADQSQIKLLQNKSPNKKQLPSFGNLDYFQKSSENIDQQIQDDELDSKRKIQGQEAKEPDNISTSAVQSQLEEKIEDQFQSNSLTVSSIQNYQLQKIKEKNNLQFLPNKKQKESLKNQNQLLNSSEQTQSSKILLEKRITFGIFKQGDQNFEQEQENNADFLNEGGKNEVNFNLNNNI